MKLSIIKLHPQNSIFFRYPAAPSATTPGIPILPFPNSEGIGALPEVIESDATRTRSPRPEVILINILEKALIHQQQSPSTQPLLSPIAYQTRTPGGVIFATPAITPDQMAIFYVAEQMIPIPMRPEFMSKTMSCLRDYDYLMCAKYATWPTLRQTFPSLPPFPDIFGWLPTFALPDFSQYIPDLSSYFPDFGGFVPGGTTTPAPQPIPESPPPESLNSSAPTNTSSLLKDDQRLSLADRIGNPVENRILHILSNIKLTVLTSQLPRNAPFPQQDTITPLLQENLSVLQKLTYNQLRILGIAKAVIPAQIRSDLDARMIGCLQGGTTFVNCTRNVIWPTLKIYVKDMPMFPGDEAMPIGTPLKQLFVPEPISDEQIQGRSPAGSEISAEPEVQEEVQSEASAEPLISVTDTRFTPIFTEHPETVLLKILRTIQSSSKIADITSPATIADLFAPIKSRDVLNPEEMGILEITANLLPSEVVRKNFVEGMDKCLDKSTFIACSEQIVWPILSEYYATRLPSSPKFNIEDKIDPVAKAAISETNVKTGVHGDAMVTITDTRFVPIYSQHPEAVILSILKNVHATSPNLLVQPGVGVEEGLTKSKEFMATFTDQQGNIIYVAENLLPESIREVFVKRMSDCVKENSFLSCTRDIAWPTIAQFFPRLPNFPNIGPPQQPPVEFTTLLPPLEPAPGAPAIPDR